MDPNLQDLLLHCLAEVYSIYSFARLGIRAKACVHFTAAFQTTAMMLCWLALWFDAISVSKIGFLTTRWLIMIPCMFTCSLHKLIMLPVGLKGY